MFANLTKQMLKKRSPVLSLASRGKSLLAASQSSRAFGAMDQLNPEMFEHEFTGDLAFRSSNDKIKCFRVMDEQGNVITPGFDTKMDDELLLKIYDKK